VQQGGSKNMLPANTANATQSNSAANNGTTSNTTSSSNTVSNSTTSGSTATGAPKLVSSTPKDTEQVQGSVTKISLTFDVRSIQALQ
jgi:phenylacetate-coenzyme A ligase PaaK-like adenylate-forming protein